MSKTGWFEYHKKRYGFEKMKKNEKKILKIYKKILKIYCQNSCDYFVHILIVVDCT